MTSGPFETLVSGAPPAPERRLPRLTVPVTTEAVVLSVLMALTFLLFLLIEPTPRWLALFGTVIAALGTEGVLRAARRPSDAGESGEAPDSTPYLFLPALLAFAIPVFAEHHVRGYWAVAAGLGGGLAFGAVVTAEIVSYRGRQALHGLARFVAAAATYFAAFALFSLAYAFELGLREALMAVALISMLLAVEMLRDDQVDAVETLVFAAIVGLVIAEARWVMQYIPVNGYLAALTLLMLFYFTSGVIHAYITRQLSLGVAGEYAGVAVAGIAVVVAARVMGVA